jgi:XTP/dITP diphosphohydrolase
MRLMFASNNPDKIAELRRILAPCGVEGVGLKEAGIHIEIEENGRTFAENAVIKAAAVHRLTGLPVIADDSGLCVDALDGEPGVRSARYCGEHTSYAHKMEVLLRAMRDVTNEARGARFISAVAFVSASGRVKTFEGVCEGKIGYAPEGENGFGYDPIFRIGPKSLAQMTGEEKDAVSHRGAALKKLSMELDELLCDEVKPQ